MGSDVVVPQTAVAVLASTVPSGPASSDPKGGLPDARASAAGSTARRSSRVVNASVHSEYPEGWSIRVLRVVADGDQAVSEVEVPHVDLGLFHAASFWTVRDGRVVAGREYWTSPGADPRPEWRARYVEPR